MTPVRLGTIAFPIPAGTAQRIGILGMSGSGKSNGAAVLVEDLFAAEQHVVVVDPTGAWYGLRSSADGKGAGLPIAILGGKFGDLPLEDPSGAFVADLVVDRRLSCVLDLSEMSENGKHRFLADFGERLFKRNEDPLYLVLEEADDYAPQSSTKGPGSRTLGAFQRIVKRGRFKGIFPVMLTQRSAALNKDLLTQCDTLLVFRSPSPQDRKAIAGWVEHHGQSKEILASLSSLPTGTCWVWSPQVLGVMEQAAVRRRRTFDSGATPVGKKHARPATVADVDVAALTALMADTIERAKADDPKELRRRIAALERQLAAKPAAAAPVVERVEVPVLSAEDRASIETLLSRLPDVEAGLKLLGDNLGAHVEVLRTALARAAGARGTVPASVARDPPARGSLTNRPAATRSAPAVRTASARGDAPLGKGARVVLIAIAQHSDGVTREQLTILTGYKRSTRDTYLQRLREKGLIEHQGETIRATEAGMATLGTDYDPLPTGEALGLYWLDRLTGGERTILEYLISMHPHSVSRDEISTMTKYARSSRDTYLQRLASRRLVEHIGGGAVRASEGLFG